MVFKKGSREVSHTCLLHFEDFGVSNAQRLLTGSCLWGCRGSTAARSYALSHCDYINAWRESTGQTKRFAPFFREGCSLIPPRRSEQCLAAQGDFESCFWGYWNHHPSQPVHVGCLNLIWRHWPCYQQLCRRHGLPSPCCTKLSMVKMGIRCSPLHCGPVTTTCFLSQGLLFSAGWLCMRRILWGAGHNMMKYIALTFDLLWEADPHT